MIIEDDVREYKRKPFVRAAKYILNVPEPQEPIGYNLAVSLDISNGGIGIITEFPLEKGQVVTFEEGIPIDMFTSKRAAVVRWSGKVNGKYRAGLKFI